MKVKASICLFSLTFLSFLILSSPSTSADTTVSANATVTVGSACSFNAAVDTPHTATIPSGTNQSDIGQTTFTVVCNDTGGYSIYAIGYSNFEVGNTKLLATINGSLNSTYDINTGSNASGTPSSWAMKLAPSTNLTSSNILNGYGSYSVVPSSYVKVATLVPSSTPVSSSSLTATYRVNIASTQPAGFYNGKVRYVLVNPATNTPRQSFPATAGCISYYPNAGSEVTDSMGDQCISSSATSATLWASNFQRPGYGFAGWSDAYDYVVNVGSESNPDAHIYGPNEDITFTAGQYSTTGLSLYAVWVESEGYLQNWNGCSSLGQGKVTALTDQRDSDTYAVAKLADGKCWMIENLRLDAADSKVASLSQGFGGVFAGLADSETNFPSDNSATINSLYYSGTQSGTASIDIGTTNYPQLRIPRYRNDNTASPVVNMDQAERNVYSYGNYYSWPAAVANTASFTGNNTDATTSLCPSGWRLPTGGDKTRIESNDGNDFWSLVVDGLNNGVQPANYSNSTTPYYTGSTESSPVNKLIRKFPNNLVYSGDTTSNSMSYRGSRGYYLVSTLSTNANVYHFSFYSTYVNPGTSSAYKSLGATIRCVINN